VTNTPDVLSDATAEIAILLLLGASRRAYEGDQMLRLGTWKHWSPVGMNGIQVSSKKLGIVGMGRVGQTVAKRARGFDMEIHYTNRRRLPAELEQGAIYHPTIKSLFEAVDMISLNCPATPETENLINAESIGWMKPGVVFVNTARGRLVDENALIDALHSGHIAAVGLDVFQTEPGGNPAFAACPNVFMLPHLGSSTRETRKAMGDRALDNLDAFFAGQEPRDRLV
jgi:lactate dehydrogenase-like 2-hydroxyacid dehydrogenase